MLLKLDGSKCKISLVTFTMNTVTVYFFTFFLSTAVLHFHIDVYGLPAPAKNVSLQQTTNSSEDAAQQNKNANLTQLNSADNQTTLDKGNNVVSLLGGRNDSVESAPFNESYTSTLPANVTNIGPDLAVLALPNIVNVNTNEIGAFDATPSSSSAATAVTIVIEEYVEYPNFNSDYVGLDQSDYVSNFNSENNDYLEPVNVPPQLWAPQLPVVQPSEIVINAENGSNIGLIVPVQNEPQ